MSNLKKIILKVNKVGLKNNPKFICVDPSVGKDKYGNKIIEVKNIKTKETKKVFLHSIVHNKSNPFSGKKSGGKSQTLASVTLFVNKLGKKANPQFISVSPLSGYKIRLGSKQKHRLVKIMCVETKEVREVELSNLKRGQNPFRTDYVQTEVRKVQPMYERLFKKLNIKYEKEYAMGSKRLDYVFIKNGKKYGLEVKQSDKWHSVKNQIENYRRLANLKPFQLEKVLLSDPSGSHKSKGSLSLKEFEKFLLK